MANISPKLFQNAIKGLKTTLFTALTMALMLRSSGALGGILYVEADVAALRVGDDDSLSAAWENGAFLLLRGGFNINTGEDELNIAGVRIDGDANANKTFTVSHNDITIGGNLDMNLVLEVAAGAVTVGSVGVGDVRVAGGVLSIAGAGRNVIITGGQVNQSGAIGGDLTVSGGGVLLGSVSPVTERELRSSKKKQVKNVGTDSPVIERELRSSKKKQVKNVGTETDVGGTVTVQADAGAVTINNANGLVTIKGGTLTLDGAANGINFDGAAAAGTTVTVRAGGGVVNVDNTTGGDNVGTLTFRVGGTANNIGATNSLAVVNIGAGELTVNGAAMKADAVNLTDAASVLTLTNANAVLTGAIDNTTGGDNVGILNLNGALTQVTGDIGATNSLAVVNIGAGELTVNGAAMKADAVNLTDAASVLTLTNANAVLTGAIDNTTGGDNVGILNLNGALTQVTGDIGATNSLAVVNIGAGELTVNGAAMKADAVNLTDAASVLTLTNANAVLTGAIDNTTGGDNVGILNLNGALTQVTGDIGATNSLAVVNIGAGELTVNGAAMKADAVNLTDAASVLTLTNANAVLTGAIDNTTGGDNVGILNLNGALTQVTGDIGATNSLAVVNIGAGELTVNGAAMKADAVNLTDAASILTLTNANAVLTGAIDNTTGGDNVGTLTFRVGGTANNIGATNSLAVVNIGAGELTVNGAAMKADAVNLTDAASVLTLTNANAVLTGAIDNTTGGDNVGILNLNGALTQVTGDIGATNSLAVVNIGAGELTVNGAAMKADAVNLTDAASVLTLTNANAVLTGAIDNTTGGDNVGILNLNGALTQVTGDIGATNSLAVVNIGAGELTVNGAAMKADAVNLTDAASVLTLTNANAVLTGAIDNTTGGDNVGILNLNGALTQVTGDIGATKSLATVNIAAGATLQVGGNLAANNTSFGVGGILEFNDATAYAEHTFKGAIVNGANAKLNVNTNSLTTYDPSIGTVAQINIGAGNTFAIDANGGDVNVLAANIQFANQDAVLALRNSSNTNDRTITLAADIDPNNDDEGTVFLDSAEAGRKLTIAGGVTLGGAHKLKAIVFTGAGDFGMEGITFNTTDIKLNTTGVLELGATTANVTILNDAVKLTQTANIGGFLDFAGKNGTVTLNNGVNVVGAVQNTGGNSNGTLIALGASNLGSVNGIAMLKVGTGAVTIGGAGGDIKIGEIQGNGTALLTLPANFKLTGGFNKTGGQALKLSFANGSSVSDVVGTAANPVGDITLAGTNSFANTVNSNGVMTLAKGSVTTFAKDVKATSFVANGATMEFDGNLALNGNITGSGTTLDLGANQVTYTGTGSFTDALTLDTIFDGAAKSGGNILIKSGSTLDLSGVSNLNIVLNPVNFNIDPNTKYTLISAEAAGGLKPASASNVKFTVNGQNQFIKFTIDTSTLTLTLFATDATNEVIAQEFTGVTQQSLGLMANAVAGSYSRQTLDNWNSLTNAQTVDAVGHVIQNIVKPSETVAACNQAVSGNILGNLTSINARIDKTQAAAMAAGDEDMNAQFGGWINPFIGNATQKKIQNISGYKSDTTGGTLGFDALINDDAVLGLAYTRAETDVKMKDAKQGDKNKVRSNIFSLYGLYNLPQSNLFVEGVASYGDSKVTSKARRIVAVAPVTLGYQTATGKYKLENYTGQLMAGYNYALPETVSAMPLVVTPMAGVRYSDIKDKGYKETGTTSQNLIVKGKSYNTFDGLAGAKLSSSLNVGEVALTPELYAMVDYAFKNKAPAIDARLQGMTAPFPTSSFKPKKTSFDLGAGVTIKHNMVEYGVNYDANIGNKYFAQQGSVKVRVNF